MLPACTRQVFLAQQAFEDLAGLLARQRIVEQNRPWNLEARELCREKCLHRFRRERDLAGRLDLRTALRRVHRVAAGPVQRPARR